MQALFLLIIIILFKTRPILSKDRIINGEKSPLDSWPFIGAILQRTKGNPSSLTFICGSTVWNSQFIITAAHCVNQEKPDGFYVYVGHTYKSTQKAKLNTDYLFEVSRFIIHESYNSNTLASDIALLRLRRPINFTGIHSKASCVCDPAPLGTLSLEKCLILGWGDQGKDTYPDNLYQAAVLVSTFNVTTGTVYAADLVNRRDTCFGDSGGPLLCQVTSHPKVYSFVGLTSSGSEDCSQGVVEKLAEYTMILKHIPWIERKVREHQHTVDSSAAHQGVHRFFILLPLFLFHSIFHLESSNFT